jgi:nucleoside-diphosphate-sugar epimerase
VAQRLAARGYSVIATTRARQDVSGVERGAIVLHSVPPEAGTRILEDLADKPARVVYLSSTGVYGAVRDVDETTPPAPRTERDRLRLAAERAASAGPWSSLILRPAAIYGPGRGVHAAMAAGTFRLIEGGENFVSRIHVDDLAAIAEQALLSDLTGAFPVADEEPCRSREIAKFCARLMGLPMPPSEPLQGAAHARYADRRVNGMAIRRALGVDLRFPSYRVGIPACLAEEG